MNDGPFQCAKCYKTYKDKGSVKRHLVYECGKGPMFKCPLCPYRCKRQDALKAHLRSKRHNVRLLPLLI